MAATVGVIIFSPILAVCAIAIYLEDQGPVLFRQTRVGAGGKPFLLLKLRSMRHRAKGQSITAGGDSRVTRVGKILRYLKLDEAPQLWNVVRGEMSIIGPRPEVPEYVDLKDPQWMSVLSVRPGITDPASLVFRHEEQMLAECGEENVDAFYRQHILPKKLAISSRYASVRSPAKDMRLIALTLKHVLSPAALSEHELASRFFS